MFGLTYLGRVRTPSLLTQRQSTICELLFPTSVLAVKLNRKRMVVVLEEEIYIYDVSTMKLLHTIETSPNPNGASPDSAVLCFQAHLIPFLVPLSHLRPRFLVRELNHRLSRSATPAIVIIWRSRLSRGRRRIWHLRLAAGLNRLRTG